MISRALKTATVVGEIIFNAAVVAKIARMPIIKVYMELILLLRLRAF